MVRLSICAEMFYGELPFVERARRIAKAGFLVDFWTWKGHDVEALGRRSGHYDWRFHPVI